MDNKQEKTGKMKLDSKAKRLIQKDLSRETRKNWENETWQ